MKFTFNQILIAMEELLPISDFPYAIEIWNV